MPSFHVLSDLHLEHFPGFRLDPAKIEAPLLVLAGDVGSPSDSEYVAFLEHCSQLFEEVFVVMGNHEAYGMGTLEDGIAAVTLLIDRDLPANVHFLNRSAHDLQIQNTNNTKVRILGTTLWSHVPDKDAIHVQCFLTDYRMISGFTVPKNNAVHIEDVRWLEGEISRAETDGVDIVVVTHHAPSFQGTSHPKTRGSLLNSAFATDLHHLLKRTPVKLWVHGHTHYSNDQKIGQCNLVSNQRGYLSNPEEGNRFDPYKVFETYS